jgi:hypothetical protein
MIDHNVALRALAQRRRLGTSVNGDKSMSSVVIKLSRARNPAPVPRILPFVPQRAGFTDLSHHTSEIIRHPERDAYLLLLLADQELTAGRSEQARFLVDAAYDAFDGQSGES